MLNRIEDADVSLDQMSPSSEFLAELAASSDPGVPYTIIAGDTSLIPDDPEAGPKQRLLKKLGKLVEFPFVSKPNDIAVLVDSIVSIPVGRTPSPKVIPVACNHLSYFSDPSGLQTLADAIASIPVKPTTSDREGDKPQATTSASAAEAEEPEGEAAASGGIQPWIWLLALLLVGGLAAFAVLQLSQPEPEESSFERIEQKQS